MQRSPSLDASGDILYGRWAQCKWFSMIWVTQPKSTGDLRCLNAAVASSVQISESFIWMERLWPRSDNYLRTSASDIRYPSTTIIQQAKERRNLLPGVKFRQVANWHDLILVNLSTFTGNNMILFNQLQPFMCALSGRNISITSESWQQASLLGLANKRSCTTKINVLPACATNDSNYHWNKSPIMKLSFKALETTHSH